MMIDHLNKKFYFSKRLYDDLLIYVRHMVENNEDIPILIDGQEGSGKSTFTRQIAVVISYILLKEYDVIYDPNINCLQWTLDSYTQRSLMGDKYQINILDESRRLLNRRNFNNKETRKFSDYMSECRKYNQVHFILLPAFHDIDKYILLWRAKIFLHCIKYVDDNGNLVKGHFKNYPIDQRLFYMWDEGRYRYPAFSPKKFGGYQDKFPAYEAFDDMNKYEDRQRKHSLEKYGVKETLSPEQKHLQKTVEVVGTKKAAEILGVSVQTIYNRLNSVSAAN